MRVRRSELAVLACTLVFAAVLVYSFRPGRRPAPGGSNRSVPAPGADVHGQATTLLNGFDFTEESRGKPTMRIKADRTIGYGAGAGLAPDMYAGEKVTLTLYPDDGAPVTVNADRGTYDERTREARLEGNVHWSDEQGSLAETTLGLFHPSTHSLEAPQPVHFARGSIDLTAPSARYDLREKALHLAGPIEGAGDGADSAGLSKVAARSGIYRREQGFLELETFNGSSRAGDQYAADHVTVKSGASGGRTEWMRGTGNVRGILAPGHAVAGASSGAPIQRQYAGDESFLTFDTDGKPRTLAFTGAPAILSEPARRLTAPKIDLVFQDGRVASAVASGGVRVDGQDSRAESDRGTVGFSPAGDAENLALEGSVRVESDGKKGDAARAVELDAKGLWLLTGDATRSARVESGTSKLSADRIELDRPHNQVRGQGHARAVLGPDAQKKSGTVTFIGDPKRPSYAKADRIVLDDTAQTAVLSGTASVWQEDSSLFADDITLSDAEKTVVAVQNVRAVLAPDRTAKPGDKTGEKAGPKGAEKAAEKAAADKSASVVTSRRLVYRETERTGRFEGGVVVTRGAGWRATGGESTAWLGNERGVDCMEISGDANLVDRVVGRTARAEKIVDYPRQGKSVLWGDPARVTDASGNKVAGAVLTIFDRGGSVEVTAPEGGKTETIHKTEKN
ncbi:MAG TPA: LptA/OstA family protein [Thermoanaerobaculia bacterium]|nr:LptA/OstA family protein [Thermoanaerobaculia bacterium]